MKTRKATKTEIEELAKSGQLAENSVFDGVNYTVAVKEQSSGSSGSTTTNADKKADNK